MNYYAFRYSKTIIDRESAKNLPVTWIMKDQDIFLGGWLTEIPGTKECYYLTGILKREYDLLDAFGVQSILAEDARYNRFPPRA